MPESELLTIEQVAEHFHLSPVGLYSQRHRGENPGALGVKVGRRILWKRSDLDAWFESQKQDAAARAS